MINIQFKSPLIALIATCGMVSAAVFAQGALAADPMERNGGGGSHGPGAPSHGPSSPSHGPSGPSHGGAPGGGGGGFHPPAPTPNHGGPGHGGNPGGNPGYHPPAPIPGGHPGYHPPAPNPGYHPPAPTPGGHGGYHPPTPIPGGQGGYHPPAPTPFPGGGHSGGHEGGHYVPPHAGFPVGHSHGPGYSYGHDHYGNIVSPVYHDRVDQGRRRMDDMRRDSRIHDWVDRRGSEFRSHEHDRLIEFNDRFVRYRTDYRERFSPWWNEGFYGGCYWDFHPYYDIDTYFYNPVVYWFYGTDQDDYFYRTWYGSDYDRYPEFRTRFRYSRVFFPTEEFRDLNLGVSALGIEAQANYLRASSLLGDRLAVELRNRGGAELNENAVAIDHYQILPDDQGVVVEGVVDQDDVQFAFKAVQNLSDPDRTMVFAASADEDMSSESVDQLRALNTQIEDLGGVTEGQDQGPVDPANPEDGDPSDWGDQNGSN